jgi:predicted aspartyl protease
MKAEGSLKKGRTCSWLLAPLLLLCCAAKHPTSRVAELHLAGYTGVQLTRGAQNHLLLHGNVNGHAASFVLDTGSAVTFLRADRARNLGVSSTGRQYTLDNGGSLPLAAIDLRVGDMVFGKTDVGLADPSQLAGSLPADGSIGLDLLRRYKAVINCRTKQLFFRSDSSGRMDLSATTAARGFARVPIREDRHGYLMVPCSLGGKQGRMMVDTGAFVTIMNETALRYRGVEGRNSNLTASSFDDKVRQLQVARIDNLKIGSVPIAPHELAMMNLTGEAGPRKSLRIGFSYVEAIERRDTAGEIFFGLLGNDLLDYQQAIIDLDSMSLFLK